jgi:hypothetical protein
VETTTTMGCVTARSSARIFNAAALACGTPWMWTLLCGFHEDRTPTHGYETAREAAMAAFAKMAAAIGPPCVSRKRVDRRIRGPGGPSG